MTHPMLKRKGADSRGSAAYIFALLIIPLVAVVGFALDTSRQVSIDRHLEYATDMASLSAARAMEDASLSDADIETIAKAAYVQNLKTGFKDAVCAEATPIVDRANSSVKVTGSCKLPTVFGMSLSGVDEISVSSDATAQVTNTRLELALMVDISTSMTPPKLQAMRDAATDLVDLLLDGTTGTRVRISIVPFGNGVNAGSFGNLAMGRTALDDRAGDGVDRVCVMEREATSPAFLTDAAPAPGAWVQEQENWGWRCPRPSVTPLTSDIVTLRAAIAALEVDPISMTHGHMGVAWAWYSISPSWGGIWPGASAPRAYNATNTVKAAILMTDGAFNYGHVALKTVRDSVREAGAFCSGMRDEGVIIYSVGFDIDPDPSPWSAESTMRLCVDNDDDKYFAADDADELRAAYVEIASRLKGTNIVE